jgi:hypothetical protein
MTIFSTLAALRSPSRGAALRPWAVVCLTLLLAACQRGDASADGVGAAPIKATRPADAMKDPPCSADVAEWTEEVELFNGDKVEVWRRARRCPSGFPNSKRGRVLDSQLRHEPSGAFWSGLSGRDPTAFEIIDGTPYLVLYLMLPHQCEGKPLDYPLAEILKWTDGRWVEVPHAQFAWDRALLNLHARYWGGSAKDDAKGRLSASETSNGWGAKWDRTTLKEYFG